MVSPGGCGTTPVTGYEVALDDRSFVVGANVGSVTVQPLDPGVEVAFRVRALSASGASPWADAPVVAPGPGENLFSDVEWGHEFHREIRAAVDSGIVGGYDDGTFRPTAPVSRQAAAVFLWRMAGAPEGPFPDPGLSDVPAGHEFATAIWWAAAEGITTGYVDGTFRPTSPVTRQAWMAFQWRAAGEPAPACGDAYFSDVADSHEFVEPITWAACEGITSGYGDGTFRPGATVSRQAAVAFLVRPSLPAWGPLSED